MMGLDSIVMRIMLPETTAPSRIYKRSVKSRGRPRISLSNKIIPPSSARSAGAESVSENFPLGFLLSQGLIDKPEFEAGCYYADLLYKLGKVERMPGMPSSSSILQERICGTPSMRGGSALEKAWMRISCILMLEKDVADAVRAISTQHNITPDISALQMSSKRTIMLKKGLNLIYKYMSKGISKAKARSHQKCSSQEPEHECHPDLRSK